MSNEILKRARELLTPEGRWIKGALARSADGADVRDDFSNATCFCALGAINVAWYSMLGGEKRSFLDAALLLEDQLPAGMGIPAFNDDPKTTHADVLAAFDRAIG